MRITKKASAGLLEKGDILVTVAPIQEDTKLCIRSTIYDLFGERITATIQDQLARMHIDHVLLEAEDMGAFDFVIRARVEAAIHRAREA